jgi:hypothetical protein
MLRRRVLIQKACSTLHSRFSKFSAVVVGLFIAFNSSVKAYALNLTRLSDSLRTSYQIYAKAAKDFPSVSTPYEKHLCTACKKSVNSKGTIIIVNPMTKRFSAKEMSVTSETREVISPDGRLRIEFSTVDGSEKISRSIITYTPGPHDSLVADITWEDDTEKTKVTVTAFKNGSYKSSLDEEQTMHVLHSFFHPPISIPGDCAAQVAMIRSIGRRLMVVPANHGKPYYRYVD